MAWRFKASKYKNAAPIVPKPEACIRDISVGSYQTYGNNIAASAAFMAFNVDHNGSSLAVLPIDDCGRKSKTMPLLHAHSDTVTDMAFSPFHDGLLATGSQDCLVKVWHIPEGGLEESLSVPECTFSHKQRRVETVAFHPTADGLMSTSSYTTLALWDLAAQQEVFSNGSEHGDVIQSVAWRRDGSLIATSCKDKQVRVGDPRSPKFITHSANSHQSIKDSRVVWLGDSGRLLTTGFDSGRQREVFLRDLRRFEEADRALVLDSSTGVLMPLFDPDTGMLFLAAKGDTTVLFLELLEREPFLAEGLRHTGEQTKGACLVPKRALAVMQGEVNRLLQLTSSAVVPITYQVPRKSYRDFHADLYPDTPGADAPLSAAQWLSGKDAQVARISLDPANRTNAGAAPQVCLSCTI
ncbi:Lissencephaly-1 homolog [Gryllus bimaculatus]|nr:Lissencephaly-1 homolog [Gryllus bimaculatus]